MKEALQKIETLLEALPYIQKFKGKSIVIKYGGAAMSQANLRAQFAQDVVLLRLVPEVGVCGFSLVLQTPHW